MMMIFSFMFLIIVALVYGDRLSEGFYHWLANPPEKKKKGENQHESNDN